MNHLIKGFADEVVKLATYPQHELPSPAYVGAAPAIMEQAHGASSKTGLKGAPKLPAPALDKPSPTAITTPNYNVDG